MRLPHRASLGLVALLALSPVAHAAPEPPTNPQLLQEMAQDVQRYAEAVKGYRSAATSVIKRVYMDKMKTIKSKYEAEINQSEKEERQRRLDAIAMFEGFLKKYPNDRRWTPDAMFRLAELYYEKSSDEYLTAQEAFQKALESPTPPDGQPPKPDYGPTVDLYRRLLTDFPTYRLLDAAYYLLGYCLAEMGKEAESNQALLALTCSNRYKPLDPPPPPSPTTRTGVKVDVYKDCVPVRKGSKFLAEAWTRVGETHFDAGELGPAISAYSRVVAIKDSSYYDKALYKLAWSYYRDNRFPEAIREFDNLVKFADGKKASGEKFGSDLRPEAVQYLGVSFSEPDWDGDTNPDPETGLQRAQTFYKGRESEPHVKEVFQRLGDIYFDSTKYPEAIAVYRSVLQKWPTTAEAPQVQDKIVKAYEKDRNMAAASKEREILGRTYQKGSEWYKANRADPDALALGIELAEQALQAAAQNVHIIAQACKDKWRESPSDLKKLQECQKLYGDAAELYKNYLTVYPNSKSTYEFSESYADTLYYADRLPEAIVAYTAVRDSSLDNKYQEEAAVQIMKSYEGMIAKLKDEKKLEDPPIPDQKNTKPPVTPLEMPDVYQKYLVSLDWFVKTLPNNPRVPGLRYAAAVLMLRYRNWPVARTRLQEVADFSCTSAPETGLKAYSAILETYFIDYLIEDEEQKDCALGKLLLVADQFGGSVCGKSPSKEAAEYTARFNGIRTSVKSAIISKRLTLAMENEEKGTNKQITQCKEGNGGIAIVTGTATTPGTTPDGKPVAAGPSKVSTDIDISLALDLLDMINANPKDQDAPGNLNNVCVIYEKLFQYGEATKCYERLAREYPESVLVKDAIWNAARNHFRFFEFEQAVTGFVKVATDPKFAEYEHRKEALAQAAILLDNDQQYARAADFYKRYADAVADKPLDSSEAFAASCSAYEKLKDTDKLRKCLNDLIKRYSSQQPAGPTVVNSLLKLATIAEQGKDQKATFAAYKRVRDEFISRKLPAASEAAGAAAKADYLLLDEKFKAFQVRKLEFKGKPEQIKKTFDDFVASAKALREEYQKIFEYKYATWSLASYLRSGDIFYEFSQKLIKAADNPPDDLKKLAKMACKANPDDCGVVEGQYKDAIFQFVTPIEDEAKKMWRDTLEMASKLGVTNEYVKSAREKLSKYLPDEFPFIKDEKVAIEAP